ncbi:DUF885 domain-containing protein [Leptospira perolatii]|uniref:DUF885 domain-containing protein n=1 Tax=Leptospira perolatii TaxID=2023191 RepID=A0A2M9ZRC7_9LEPT|nr:DUF885 domain-containing protein [Leptospira perolatii]PJZ71105.1 DUF885 domain-containing protein [Leptospira perolatii]PJZ74637.1 DUF885 domain-containing protein [Leptospira perolatii]
MKRIGLAVISLLFFVLLTIAFVVYHTWNFRPFTLSLFYEKIFWQDILDDPETLSSLRILDAWGVKSHNSRWTDASPEHELEVLERYKQQLATLKTYDVSSLQKEEKAYYKSIEWSMEHAVSGQEFIFHNYPVNQLFGLQNHIPTFLATVHSIEDKKDASAYIERLRAVPFKIGQLLNGLKLRENRGVFPPDFILDRVITEIQRFRTAKTEENIVIKSFSEKLSKVEAIDSEERKKYLKDAQRILVQEIYKSYGDLELFLRAQREKSDSKAGVWKLPNGDEYYKYVLKLHTTTSLSPEDVYQLGLSEVDRIQEEMKSILKSLKVPGNNLASALNQLRLKKESLFPDTEDGKELALNEYRKILQQSTESSKALFPGWPKAKVEVQRIPKFKEAGAPGAYYEEPSLDGKRPGVFYANLRDTKEIPKFGMRTLTYHETIPGHHLQIAWAQELSSSPKILRTHHFTAYVEGWALYAEKLASEFHFYEDPLSDLGRLQAELFRAVRLVVDTGIHYKRWNREQAIKYMTANTGMAPKDVTAEVERYIVYPGQACSYKIGMLTLLKLRTQWEQSKASKYQIKDFHGFILNLGSLPLEILEERMKEEIAIDKRN